MNKQLQSLWKRTPDDIYVQPSWDGETYAFETLGESAIWAKAFRQPIVAVFDVVEQDSGFGGHPKPIVLLQPRPRLQELFPTRAAQLGGIRDKTVVNRVGNSLYAMGHLNYPLVNLAEVYLELEGGPQVDGARTSKRCEGVSCFLGVKYAEREDAKSRISRLIDPPPGSDDARSVKIRNVSEQDGAGPDGELTDPVPTTIEIAALPFPSRLSASADSNGDKLISLLSQIENNRPKPGGAPGWTVLLPFVGGFLAVWFILRKLINLNNNPNQHLSQPLLEPSPQLEATGHPLTPSRVYSRPPSHATAVYPNSGGTSRNISSNASQSTQVGDSEMLSEKGEFSEKVDPDVNVRSALDDPRGGPGLGVAIDAKEGEDSDKDDGDVQDGNKKRRRNRRRRKRPTGVTPGDANQENDAPPEPIPAVDSGVSSGGYVMVDKEPAMSAKMELPMPVTTSASSLVVGTKVLGMPLSSHYNIPSVLDHHHQVMGLTVQSFMKGPCKVARWQSSVCSTTLRHSHLTRYRCCYMRTTIPTSFDISSR